MARVRLNGTVTTASSKGTPGISTSQAQYSPCSMFVLPVGSLPVIVES